MCPTHFVMLSFGIIEKIIDIEVGEAFLSYKPEQKL